jgi:hypothetical protein
MNEDHVKSKIFRNTHLVGAVVILVVTALYFVLRPTPSAPQIKAFQQVRKICLSISQQYFDTTDSIIFLKPNQPVFTVSLPVKQVAEAGLRCAGIDIQSGSGENCDARVVISLEGSTSKECKMLSYTNVLHCAYLQTKLRGKIIFALEGISPYQERFKRQADTQITVPAMSTTTTYLPTAPDPEDAPWEEAFTGEGSLPYQFMEMLGRLSGAPPLKKCVKDSLEPIQRASAWAVGELGYEEGIDSLVNVMLSSAPRLVRHEAATALQKLDWEPAGVEQGVPYLIILFKENQIPRKYGSQAVPYLLKIFNNKDEDSVLRMFALETLGDIRDARAEESFIHALQDKDRYLRSSAARILAEHPDPQTYDTLIVTLKDPYEYVRSSAARALGNLGDVRAIPSLIELLQDPFLIVREDAEAALEKITGEHFGKDYNKWKEWWAAQ